LKRLVFTGPREYKFEDIDAPEIQHSEDVLIEVKGIGICGTDMHIFSGNRKVSYPHVAGHECVGIVKKVGLGWRDGRIFDDYSRRRCLWPSRICTSIINKVNLASGFMDKGWRGSIWMGKTTSANL
jgi:hypothetical protein